MNKRCGGSLGLNFEKLIVMCMVWSRNSSVVIATRYGLDGPDLIPSKGKIFLFSTAYRPILGPTQPPIQWVRGALSHGVNRQGREADQLPPSSAEVKNDGAISPLSPMSSWNSA
jgi:hypothetical protein